MDPKILTGILHSDTHIRLQAGEQLLEYLRSEQNELEELEELESLISGLANWMTSNNFKVRHLSFCSGHVGLWFAFLPYFWFI